MLHLLHLAVYEILITLNIVYYDWPNFNIYMVLIPFKL